MKGLETKKLELEGSEAKSFIVTREEARLKPERETKEEEKALSIVC